MCIYAGINAGVTRTPVLDIRTIQFVCLSFFLFGQIRKIQQQQKYIIKRNSIVCELDFECVLWRCRLLIASYYNFLLVNLLYSVFFCFPLSIKIRPYFSVIFLLLVYFSYFKKKKKFNCSIHRRHGWNLFITVLLLLR